MRSTVRFCHVPLTNVFDSDHIIVSDYEAFRDMKKNVLIFIMLINICALNAQKYSTMDQSELRSALSLAKEKVRSGKIIACTGMVCGIAGAVILPWNKNRLDMEDNSGLQARTAIGGILLAGGIVTTLVGIPNWAAGANRKRKIELELVRFKTPGSASAGGVGISLTF